MAERWKIGNQNQAVQETENEGENLYRRGGAGGQRHDKEDLHFKFCTGCSATGWNSGRLALRLQEPKQDLPKAWDGISEC